MFRGPKVVAGFQEAILLSVWMLGGATLRQITEEVNRRLDSPVTAPSVHRTLERLEKKGMVEVMVPRRAARAGTRPYGRTYRVTKLGEHALEEAKSRLLRMYVGWLQPEAA